MGEEEIADYEIIHYPVQIGCGRRLNVAQERAVTSCAAFVGPTPICSFHWLMGNLQFPYPCPLSNANWMWETLGCCAQAENRLVRNTMQSLDRSRPRPRDPNLHKKRSENRSCVFPCLAHPGCRGLWPGLTEGSSAERVSRRVILYAGGSRATLCAKVPSTRFALADLQWLFCNFLSHAFSGGRFQPGPSSSGMRSISN